MSYRTTCVPSSSSMSACKTLIRTSLSCLEVQAPIPISTTLRHLPFTVSYCSVVRFKPLRLFSVSRSFGIPRAVISSETSDCTEEIAVNDTETAQDSCTDRVEELFSKNKDHISGLMKMERSDVRIGEHWFPYLDLWKAGAADLNSSEILEAMDPYILDARKERFRTAVNNRSYSLCLVVEGLSDFGNVSAAFRSADALGIQSVHVVSCDSSKRYRDNRHVSMGAEKWLDIELWDSVGECYQVLRARGYRIAAAYLGMDTVSVYDVDWSCPTAIVVGNEKWGISKEALEHSDLGCSIPMRGMVDSFNVSVAAGLLMHQAVCDRTVRMGCHGDLTQQERQILQAEFYLRHNKNALNIASEFSHRKLAMPSSKL